MKDFKYLADFFAMASGGGVYLYICLTVSIKHKYIKPLITKTKEIYKIDGFDPSNAQNPEFFNTIFPSTCQRSSAKKQLTAVDGLTCTVPLLGLGSLKSTPKFSHSSYHCTPALVLPVKARDLDRLTTTLNIAHHTDGAIQRHYRWARGRAFGMFAPSNCNFHARIK